MCDADELTECYKQKWRETEEKKKTQNEKDKPNQNGYRNEWRKLGRNTRKHLVREQKLREIYL